MSKTSLRKTVMDIKKGDSFKETDLDVIFKGIGEHFGGLAKWAFDECMNDDAPRKAIHDGTYIWHKMKDSYE